MIPKTPVAVAVLGLPSVWGATLLASHYTGRIFTLELSQNETAYNLELTSDITGCGSTPAWLELYAEDNKLYCFDEDWNGSGVIESFDVGEDGVLTSDIQFGTAGGDVHGVLYGGPEGKSFIATAQYSPSTITTYRVPTSSNNSVLQLQQFSMSAPGPNPRQDAPHPHEIIVDPSGTFILVPDLGADLIRTFSIDLTSGQLTSCGDAEATPGDGPRHGKFWTRAGLNGTGDLLYYSLNELGNSVSVYTVSYQDDCISLEQTQTISTYEEGVTPGPLTKASELHIFGNFLYAANRADETFGSEQDSLAIYSIDPTSGALSWIEATNAHAFYPRTFQINKEGTLVAVGGQTSSNVAIISRNVETGKLEELVANIQVAEPGRPGEEDGLSAVVWVE